MSGRSNGRRVQGRRVPATDERPPALSVALHDLNPMAQWRGNTAPMGAMEGICEKRGAVVSRRSDRGSLRELLLLSDAVNLRRRRNSDALAKLTDRQWPRANLNA